MRAHIKLNISSLNFSFFIKSVKTINSSVIIFSTLNILNYNSQKIYQKYNFKLTYETYEYCNLLLLSNFFSSSLKNFFPFPRNVGALDTTSDKVLIPSSANEAA